MTRPLWDTGIAAYKHSIINGPDVSQAAIYSSFAFVGGTYTKAIAAVLFNMRPAVKDACDHASMPNGLISAYCEFHTSYSDALKLFGNAVIAKWGAGALAGTALGPYMGVVLVELSKTKATLAQNGYQCPV